MRNTTKNRIAAKEKEGVIVGINKMIREVHMGNGAFKTSLAGRKAKEL